MTTNQEIYARLAIVLTMSIYFAITKEPLLWIFVGLLVSIIIGLIIYNDDE